jgi:hypothetical protein
MSEGFDELGKGLADVQHLVRTLQVALENRAFKEGRSAANQLVSTTTRWISEAQGDPTFDPDLGAALQVFRNAGFAFRRLAKSDGESQEQLSLACSTLLAQGSDLLQAYERVQESDDQGPHRV